MKRYLVGGEGGGGARARSIWDTHTQRIFPRVAEVFRGLAGATSGARRVWPPSAGAATETPQSRHLTTTGQTLDSPRSHRGRSAYLSAQVHLAHQRAQFMHLALEPSDGIQNLRLDLRLGVRLKARIFV